MRRWRRPAWLGTVRRTRPLSDSWGRDRGNALDRYFIEDFMRTHAADIRGRVVEVMDDRYTTRFGTAVESSEILDVDPANDRATLVADLGHPAQAPAERYDCCVMTQTLQFVFDTAAAVESAHRMLRPGGVLLVTAPAVSRLDRGARTTGEYWRFAPDGLRRLLEDRFGADNVDVRPYGNVLTCIAFLLGMAREELKQSELDEHDEFFPLVVAGRAVKR